MSDVCVPNIPIPQVVRINRNFNHNIVTRSFAVLVIDVRQALNVVDILVLVA